MATAAVLPSLSIPSAPFSPPILYPSSPIAQFPPPVPAIRTLRDRCGFSLKIKTTFTQHDHMAPCSNKGHVQPHRNHLPRRRKGQRRIVLKEEAHVVEVKSQEIPVAPSDLSKPDGRHLQEIIPGLSLAFKPSDDSGEDTVQSLEDGFTHLVDICDPPAGSDELDCGSVEQAWDGRVHRLRLVLPTSARADDSLRAGLALTDAQLRAARDFLAQALPYSGTASNGTLGVRTLVCTPAHRPTDALSVAGCYLAFVSAKSVETVLRFIDAEADFLSVWKGEVSGYEMEKIEKVARKWSWLSNLRR